jgi:primosomal protein N' (replication factor Y)
MLKGELFKDETCWAEVILPLALPTLYSYAIPPEWLNKAMPGCRVEVSFGKNKRYTAIIRRLQTTPPSYKTKPILQVLDDEPLLYEQQLKLWDWISEYYMCTVGEVMAAALPANFKLSSETYLMFNEEAGEDFSGLSNNEFLVAEALLIRKQLQLSEVQQILEVNHVYPVIKKLLEKNICYAWEQLQYRYIEKRESYVMLHPDLHDEEKLSQVLNDWKGAPKQMELMLAYLHLANEGEVKKADLLKKAKATAAQLNALQEKQLLLVEKRRVDRIPVLAKELKLNYSFSAAQQEALDSLRQQMQQKQVCLLQGVTGSGKTLLYIELIAECIGSGKQALYLLPEIALTAQIIRRLQGHFGGHIAVYHSKFNNQERVELWNKVRKNEVQVVLGPRSALMLPFNELGLIIVDEEHDPSYKQQEPAPRYHARDTAIYFAALTGAKVILGSATPSLESYQHALSGKYGLAELPERFGNLLLPEIEIVNTTAFNQKGKTMISPPLKEAVEHTLQEERQVILFQNRRGYNPYIICGTCGYIPQCTHCDVSLTLHKFSNKLHCHYCGESYPKFNQCPACGVNHWVEKNFGTEKIEEQLETDFKDYRIARMDVDTVRGKHAHDELIKRLEEHKIDILVGTQMVVKGLDFEKLGLVGILDADGLLSFTDFRVNERAFQLMEQVSGRAGRKHKRGKVLIQAMQSEHPVLKLVQQHDYKKFYEWEMEKRKEFGYPPFTRLILLQLKHKDRQVVHDASFTLAEGLKKSMGSFLTGPAQPVISRIRNQYIMEIMIRLPKDNRMAGFKQVIKNQIALLQSEKKYASVQVIMDVDAV